MWGLPPRSAVALLDGSLRESKGTNPAVCSQRTCIFVVFGPTPQFFSFGESAEISISRFLKTRFSFRNTCNVAPTWCSSSTSRRGVHDYAKLSNFCSIVTRGSGAEHCTTRNLPHVPFSVVQARVEVMCGSTLTRPSATFSCNLPTRPSLTHMFAKRKSVCTLSPRYPPHCKHPAKTWLRSVSVLLISVFEVSQHLAPNSVFGVVCEHLAQNCFW